LLVIEIFNEDSLSGGSYNLKRRLMFELGNVKLILINLTYY